MLVFPNPVDKTLTIEYNELPDFAEKRLFITSIYGQIVKNIPLNGTRGSIDVNVGGVSEGIYYYYVPASGKALFSGKLIIAH